MPDARLQSKAVEEGVIDVELALRHLRDALVVAYDCLDRNDDMDAATLGALGVIRHALEETGGFHAAYADFHLPDPEDPRP